MTYKENRFTYFKIGNRKFQLEKCCEDLWEITMFEGGKFRGTWCFGDYEGALANILSYSEITEDDYNA